MANRERGEVDIQIAGRTYIICLDLNAMALIENYFSTPDRDVTFYEVFGKMRTGGVRYIRAVLWAGLHKHHPNISIEDVGQMIQEAGGLSKFGDLLQARIVAAGLATLPDKQDLADLGVNANGQNPRASRGRGERSSSTRTASA